MLCPGDTYGLLWCVGARSEGTLWRCFDAQVRSDEGRFHVGLLQNFTGRAIGKSNASSILLYRSRCVSGVTWICANVLVGTVVDPFLSFFPAATLLSPVKVRGL